MDFDKPRRLHFKKDYTEYQRIHAWVRRNLGRATQCSIDSSHVSTRYHWANISYQYAENASDWKQLCPRCHKAMDGVSDAFKEIKRQQALGNTNRARAIRCVELGATWANARLAADYIGVVHTAINNCLVGRSNTSGGYHWEYIGE